MCKAVLVGVASMFATMIVRAQEIPDRQREEIKPMVKEKVISRKQIADLNLTDDQKAQLKSINQDFHKQMEDLKKQDNISVKEYREKTDALRRDQETRFESLLTPQQKATMQKDQEAFKAKGNNLGKKKLERMREELNLTDDQVAKMSESRKLMAEKIQAIQQDKSLNDEQKKTETKEAIKRQKQDMRSILTDEQLQKLKESRKQSPNKKQTV